MKLILPVFIIIALLSTGCWVRIAGGGKSPFSEYVGRSGTTRVDYVVVDILSSHYIATPKGMSFDEDHKGYVMTLEKGTIFRVTGTASRRLESGVHFYLECRCEKGEKIIFDYPAQGHWDPLGPKYIKWDNPRIGFTQHPIIQDHIVGHY